MPDLLQPVNFSDSLLGKEGHQSLVGLNEHELKLFDEIRCYMDKRAKIDLDYAEKVNKLHSGMRHESNQAGYGSRFETAPGGRLVPGQRSMNIGMQSRMYKAMAWKAFLTESENRGITMAEMARELQTSVSTRMVKVITGRKELLRKYTSDRNKFDHSFNCSKDEVKRLSNSYREAQKDVAKAKEKLDDLSSKGKAGKDWMKVKERFDRASRKLHQNHNDYILAIEGANVHQKVFVTNLIPLLMETMQETQQGYIAELKELMLELFKNTNWCRLEFTSSADQVQQTIELMNELEEYRQFEEQSRVKPQPVVPFFFDETLMTENLAEAGLTADELVINDLTHDQLIYRQRTLESQLDVLYKDLKTKEDALGRIETDFLALQSTRENVTNMMLLEKRIQLNNVKRDIAELRCKENVAKCQYEHVKSRTDELGDKRPPAYFQIEPPSAPLLYPEHPTDMRSKTRHSLSLPFMSNKKKRAETQQRLSLNGDDRDAEPADGAENDDDFAGEFEEPEERNALDTQTWFHGKLDRTEVPRLIKQNGDFLVREKADGSCSVVSVMVNGQIRHFILKPGDDGLFKFEGDSFSTVPELINHHHRNGIVIQTVNSVFLVNPIKRAFVKGDKFSFTHAEVQLEGKLGSGHFGDVYRGVLIKKGMPVAVKTCRENVAESVKRKFLSEAEIMKPYHHVNVMKLIGVCNDIEPYYILMELLPNGDLLNFLKKEGVHFKTKELVQMAIDAAAGMEYLEKKNTIHRDLAARNCLVGDKNVVKISDFGMSREEDDDGIYTIQTTKEIPIKWTAPEVWQYQQYTTKSDVWSYGVLLYEIFSLGNTPYPGWNNRQAREKIEEGYRMPAPTGTPQEIYTLMQQCWTYDPADRPHFKDIHATLKTIIKSVR